MMPLGAAANIQANLVKLIEPLTLRIYRFIGDGSNTEQTNPQMMNSGLHLEHS